MYCTTVGVGVGAGVMLVVLVVEVGVLPGVQTWFVFPVVHWYVCGAPVLSFKSRHWSPPVSAMRSSAVKYQCCAARPG
jgi:hypothetical protein